MHGMEFLTDRNNHLLFPIPMFLLIMTCTYVIIYTYTKCFFNKPVHWNNMQNEVTKTICSAIWPQICWYDSNSMATAHWDRTKFPFKHLDVAKIVHARLWNGDFIFFFMLCCSPIANIVVANMLVYCQVLPCAYHDWNVCMHMATKTQIYLVQYSILKMSENIAFMARMQFQDVDIFRTSRADNHKISTNPNNFKQMTSSHVEPYRKRNHEF